MKQILILTLFPFLLTSYLHSLASSQKTASPDTLKIRHYTLEGLRVIGDAPSEAIGAVHTANLNTARDAVASNVKDAMLSLPGINMSVGSKDESNLRIRGFRKNEVKILIDGRPVNAGYFGNVNLQNIPVSDIREIQILKGPASSMYGSNTLGGVVNLITKTPSTTKWFKLGMFVKRNNTSHFEISSSHAIENADYWIYFSRDHTDGFMLPSDFTPSYSENGGVRDNSSKTQQHLEGKSTFHLTDFHAVTITAGLTSIPEKYLPSSIYEATFRKYEDWLRSEVTVSSNWQFSPDTKLESMLYLDGGKDTYLEFNDPNFQNMAMDSDMKSFTYGFNPRYSTVILNSSKLTFGYRGESQYSNRKDNQNYPDWTHHSTFLHNAFSQFEWKATNSLSITGSSGISYFMKDSDAMSTQYEPSLGFYYEFQNHASLSAAIGRNTAFPTMRQLFSVENGNIDLRPQYGMKYELNGKQPFLFGRKNGLISVSLYLNEVRDLIDLIGSSYENIYHVRSYGSEVELEWNPFTWWKMNYSYGYLAYAGTSSYHLTESPKNSAQINWECMLPYHVSTTISSQWKDVRYSQDASFKYHSVASYWTHDITIRKRLYGVQVSLGLENITDTNYQEEYGYPAPGRNFCISLEREF